MTIAGNTGLARGRPANTEADTGMKCKGFFAATAITLAVIIMGCTKYNTLWYLMLDEDTRHAHDHSSRREAYGQSCGGYILHPKVWCFSNSARAPLDEDKSFGIELCIDIADGVEPIPILDPGLFAADSLTVIFHNTGEVAYVRRERTEISSREEGGRMYHDFESLIIPADTDSITLIVTGYRLPVLNDTLICDSLTFPMYRYEKSTLSVWVG